MNETEKRDLKIAAVVATVAVVSFFVIYWTVQIQDVLELLEMAYG